MRTLTGAVWTLRDFTPALLRHQLLLAALHSPFIIWFFFLHPGSGISVTYFMPERFLPLAAELQLLPFTEAVLLLYVFQILSPFNIYFYKLLTDLTERKKIKTAGRLQHLRKMGAGWAAVFLSGIAVHFFLFTVLYFYLGFFGQNPWVDPVAAGTAAGAGWLVCAWLMWLPASLADGVSWKSAAFEAAEQLKLNPVLSILLSAAALSMIALAVYKPFPVFLLILFVFIFPLLQNLITSQVRLDYLENTGGKRDWIEKRSLRSAFLPKR